MIATKTIVPQRKLKIKFTSKRIETDAPIMPCVVAPQVSLSHDSSSAKISASAAKKRGSVWVTENEDQREKRQRIERNVKAQCTAILNKLMNHGLGWIFKHPVDPVALNIPDYFSIISRPMDLGTVKCKLDRHVYSHINEFASDVRLTFSNAMTYNPPSNDVHKMAKELSQIFESRWKVMEEKYSGEGSKLESEKPLCRSIKIVIDKTASLGNTAVLKKATSMKQSTVRCSFEPSRTEPVESKKAAKKSSQKSAKKSDKGTKSSDTARRSSSEISTDRSLDGDNHAHSAVSRLVSYVSASPMRKSDPDSDVSTVDNESACPSSEAVPPATVADALSRQDDSTQSDVPLSPQKALRAALLKCRFASTIFKAQEKSLDNGDRNDPEQLKKERERLERRQLEEKARIEAEMKAAEEASRQKAAAELKLQRNRDREAARIALEKMERTAEIELNLEAQEELELLSGYKPTSRLHNRENGRVVLMASSWPVYTEATLEQLGLFIKPEYLGGKGEEEEEEEEEKEAILGCSDGEEGEIL